MNFEKLKIHLMYILFFVFNFYSSYEIKSNNRIEIGFPFVWLQKRASSISYVSTELLGLMLNIVLCYYISLIITKIINFIHKKIIEKKKLNCK